MSELHDLTAAEQLDALRAREVSSLELTEHYLQRIDKHGERLGAFTNVFADHALAAARTADAQPDGHGALHGLPLVLKDLHPTAGLTTTMGSAVLAHWVPDVDAPAVAALRAAGCVVLGKTHAPELGPVCYTETLLARPAATPYDEARSASGSSGGAAAAVAAGLAPVAHGSDGLGSIRTPAATCGLVGVKPSRGRLVGTAADWVSLGVDGPLARTVLDAALVLDAMGPHPDGDLWHAPDWGLGAHARAARTPRTGPLRVGLLTDPLIDTDVDPSCLAAARWTADALAGEGAVVEDVDTTGLVRLDDVWPALRALLQARIGAAVGQLVRPEHLPLLMPFTRWLADGAEGLSAVALHDAQRVLAAAAGAFGRRAARYDVVVTPTTTAPPLPHHALRLDDGEASAAAMLRWSAFTPWANLCGLPAVSVPVTTTDEGLPLGAQLVGRLHEDALLLGVAAALEERAGWAARRPPTW